METLQKMLPLKVRRTIQQSFKLFERVDKIKSFILRVGHNIYKAWEMGWYPFFIFLLILTTPTYGQSSESSQKQAKVIEQRNQSKPQYNNPNNNNNYRPLPPRVYTPYYYNPMVWGYTPYWNTNRRWDNRTYIVTTDENRTKSQNPPLRFSFGVLSEVTTQTPTFSPYLTIGGESFLLLQYHFFLPSPYPYYDNIYPWEVIEWEDEYIGTALDRKEFVIGFGKSVKRFSPFIGLGIGKTTQWDTYKDETYILSPLRERGYYRINQSSQTNISAKVGTMYGWEWIEMITQISFGEEIRFGLGIGIKL